uniref:Uncharacterized protein n=1 Tax=Trichuris muris TaxID=70415 RepID=A0A5S6Q2G3_TRIMR
MPPLRTVHGPAVQGKSRRCAMAVQSKGMPKGAVPAPLRWHGGSVERKCRMIKEDDGRHYLLNCILK